MSLSPSEDEYCASLRVTNGPFSKPRFIVAFGITEQDAKEKCEAMALAEGWTRPMWWQWWRKGDSVTPYPSISL